MKQTQIDIIRHGEPEGGRRYRGSGVDDPLSQTGWQQMWNAIPDDAPWQQIVSSPLLRCAEFSKALSESLNIPYSINDNLKEIGFGEWEGRTPDDIEANEGDALQAFLRDPVNNRPPGAEPLHEFAQRITSVYNEIAEAHRGQHVLVVGHAGVIRAITSQVLGMALDDVYSKLKIEYAAIACTRISEGKAPVMVLR